MPQGRQPSQLDRLVAEESDRILDEEADRQQVPRQFVRKIKRIESGGAPDVISGQRRSNAGAVGAMQLMPATARGLGVDPYDIEQNVMGGVKYAKQQLDTFGDQRLAASAYNAGPGAVKRAGGVPRIAETQKYAAQFPSGQQQESDLDKLVKQFGGTEEQAAPLERVTKPQPRIKPSRQILKQRGPTSQQPAESSPFSFTQPTIAQTAQREVAKRTAQISPEVAAEADRRGRELQRFQSRSALGQAGELLTGGALRGAEGLLKSATYLQPGPVPRIPYGTSPFTSAAQEQLQRQEAAQDVALPNAAPIARGLSTAAVQAPAFALSAGGGTLPAIGGAALLSATQEDFANDPKRAALRTALGAIAPVLGGKAAQSLIQPATLAGRLASGAAGGALGNMIPGAIEQLAYEGQLNPQQLAQQAAIGGITGAALPPEAERPVGRGAPPEAAPVRSPIPEAPLSPAELRARLIRPRRPLEEGDLFNPPSLPRQIQAQSMAERMAEYPGGELPRSYGPRLEGQPTELPEPAIRTYPPEPNRPPTIAERARILPRRAAGAEEAPIEIPQMPARERLPRIADLPRVLPEPSTTPTRPTTPAGPTAPAETPAVQPAPSPRPPSRSEQRNIERGQQVLRARDDAANARVRADEFEQQGDFEQARQATIEQIDALRATRQKVKIDTPGGRKLRADLGRQIQEAEGKAANLRKQARRAAKEQRIIERAPTAELPPSRSTQQRLAEIEQQTPSERLREYPGGELPRQPGRQLEGQPSEVTRETGRERLRPAEMPAPALQPQTETIVKTAEPQSAGARPKTIAEYAEGLRGEIPTGELQAYQRLLARNQAENPRAPGVRTRPGEPFGGFSQFNDIVRNNRGTVNRLAEMNVNSAEAQPLIRQIRDYARKNRFDEGHIDNLLNQIRNDQLQRAQGEDVAQQEPNRPTRSLPPEEPRVERGRDRSIQYERSGDPALRQKIEANNSLIDRLRRRSNDPRAQARIEELQQSNAEIQRELDRRQPVPERTAEPRISAPLEIPPETGATIQELRAQERERVAKLSPQELEKALSEVETKRNAAVRDPNSTDAQRQDLAEQVRAYRARRAELVKQKELPPLNAKRQPRGERPAAKEAVVKSPLDQDVTALDNDTLTKRINDAQRILESPSLSQDRRRKVEDFLNRGREEQGRRQPEMPLVEDRKPEYVKPSTVETPAQGMLNQARQSKEAAWKKVVSLRERLRNEPATGNRRGLKLELLKAEEAHKEALRMEREQKSAIEDQAQRLGQTTEREEPRTVQHPDEAINGKPIIAETESGKVVVANPDNKSGISIVKDRSTNVKRKKAVKRSKATPTQEPPKPLVESLSKLEFRSERTTGGKRSSMIRVGAGDDAKQYILVIESPNKSYGKYELKDANVLPHKTIAEFDTKDLNSARKQAEVFFSRGGTEQKPAPNVIEATGNALTNLEAKIANERVPKSKYFTKTQSEWLGEKIAESMPTLDQPGTRVTYKVPGDGEFTVDTPRQANRLYQKATGEYIPGAPRPDFKEAEAPLPKMSKTETYYTYERGTGTEYNWTEKPGRRVEIPGYEDLDTFIHKEGAQYRISEARTGLSVGAGETVRDAVDKAKSNFDANPGAREKIETIVKEQGLSPRYQPSDRSAELKAPVEIAAMETPKETTPSLSRERTLANGAKELTAKMGDRELTIRQLSKGGLWDVVDENGKVLRQKLKKEEAKRAARLELTKERLLEQSPPAPSIGGKNLNPDETATIDTLSKIESGFETGAPVSLTKARDASGLSKEGFDKAILGLAEKGVLALQRNTNPKSLRPEELAKLVRSPYSEDYPQNRRIQGLDAEYFTLASLREPEAGSAKPKFVTDAERRLQETTSGKRAGAGVQGLADQAIVTGYNIYRAGMRYGQWARDVMKQAGDAVRPHLQKAWQAIQRFYREEEGSAAASPGPPKRTTQISQLRAITAESLRGPAGEASSIPSAARVARIPTETSATPPGKGLGGITMESLRTGTTEPATRKESTVKTREPQSAEEYFQQQLDKSPWKQEKNVLTEKVNQEARQALREAADRFSRGKMTEHHKRNVVNAAEELMLAGRIGDTDGISDARKGLQRAVRNVEGQGIARRVAGAIARVPGQALRSVQTAVYGSDISFPLRQAGPLTLNPFNILKTARAIKASYNALGRETAENRSIFPGSKGAEYVRKQLESHPRHDLGRKAGLELALYGHPEEVYKDSIVSKLPWIKRTEAANEAFLDSMRLDVFDKFAKRIEGNPDLNEAQRSSAMKSAAEIINTMTGRTNLGEGKIKDLANAANGILGAPRLLISRAKMLDPTAIPREYAKNPDVAKQMAREAAGFGTWLALLTAGAATGAFKVNWNPSDEDFGKIVVGNKVIDPTFGQTPQVKLAWAFAKVGARTAQEAADPSEMNTRRREMVQRDALFRAGRFARSKLGPAPAYLYDLFTGQDFEKNKVNLRSTVNPMDPNFAPYRLGAPLSVTGAVKNIKEEGIGSAAAVGIPEFFGAGAYIKKEGAGRLDKKSRFMSEAEGKGIVFQNMRPEKGEPDRLFKERTDRTNQWMNQYGDELINSSEYRSAGEKEKEKALRSLKARITEESKVEDPRLDRFESGRIFQSMEMGERSQERRRRRYIYQPTQ